MRRGRKLGREEERLRIARSLLEDSVYQMIKRLRQERRSTRKPSLMAQLQQIQIDGPVDFARNLDQYLNGEKREESFVRGYPLGARGRG